MSSVRPSVMLVNCDHVGWKSSKIISPSVSLACSAFASPKRHGSTPRGTLWNFRPNISGALESGFQRTKALISLKRGKIGLRLLLKSNRKLYTSFRLVTKSMTLDDLERSLCAVFQNFGARCENLSEDGSIYCQRQRCSPMTLVFDAQKC